MKKFKFKHSLQIGDCPIQHCSAYTVYIMILCVCVCVCACVCVRACVRPCVRACVHGVLKVVLEVTSGAKHVVGTAAVATVSVVDQTLSRMVPCL